MSSKSRRDFIRGILAATGSVSLSICGCKSGGCSRNSPENARSEKAMADESKPENSSGEKNRKKMGTPAKTKDNTPSYIGLEKSGELAAREKALWKYLQPCRLCPRECGVNRLEGKAGICSEGAGFKVSSFGPHFGEERPLVGREGSGTIFFANCSLLCVYCQNWQIAHRGDGNVTDHDQLARMMLALQRRGCHNINLVTPTHIMPHIVKALRIAVGQGLNLPLVYNTGGYDKAEVLKLMDGIIDIYMPDFKYMDSKPARMYSRGASDYPKVTAAAVKEMHRQVGFLRVEKGIAHRGLLIRHLVLPHGLAGTGKFVKWVAKELGKNTAVNVMGQYRPMHRADEFPRISRSVSRKEYLEAMITAREAGLRLI